MCLAAACSLAAVGVSGATVKNRRGCKCGFASRESAAVRLGPKEPCCKETHVALALCSALVPVPVPVLVPVLVPAFALAPVLVPVPVPALALVLVPVPVPALALVLVPVPVPVLAFAKDKGRTGDMDECGA